jgi:uncharacterized membrane protein YeaQ/YmgE (transglycosylase-associated protein family)
MSIVLFVIFGFLVGLVARALMPREQRMGVLTASGLGIAGSFLGALVVGVLTREPITDLDTSGAVGSLMGALALILLGAATLRRHTHA